MYSTTIKLILICFEDQCHGVLKLLWRLESVIHGDTLNWCLSYLTESCLLLNNKLATKKSPLSFLNDDEKKNVPVKQPMSGNTVKRHPSPYLTEFFELPAQSEGGEDGVFTGKCNEGRRGQSLVDVESRAWMSKAVDLQKEMWENKDKRKRCISFTIYRNLTWTVTSYSDTHQLLFIYVVEYKDLTWTSLHCTFTQYVFLFGWFVCDSKQFTILR